ncbi:MAG: histidine kinase [Chitinophagaceae bacterium]|nr:histidine kinase [Chitinophagaceae bacterium]
MKHLYIICIAILLSHFNIFAQDDQFIFQNYNEKRGLKNNFVFSLLKDRKGILWIGTQNGLNRFDGAHFYNYQRSKQQNTLPNNSVNCLAEDSHGNIWGGTDNGIFKYNPSLNQFTNYVISSEALHKSVYNLKCDQVGNVFAASAVQLYKLDTVRKKFQVMIQLTRDKDSTAWYWLAKNHMLLDEKNHALWLATGVGLMHYQYETNILTNSKNGNGQPLFANRRVSALAQSPFGQMWMSDNTHHQLICFDPNTQKVTDSISLWSIPNIGSGSAILEDHAHRIWFGNWRSDPVVIDRMNHNKVVILSGQDKLLYSIASNFIWAALEDDNGTVWLGTMNGLSMCNPGQNVFKPNNLPQKIPALDSCAIYLTEEDPKDHTWWIATNKQWLIHYYPQSGRYMLYSQLNAIPNRWGYKPQNWNAIRFYKGQLMISTFNGTWTLIPEKKRFVPFDILPKDLNQIPFTDVLPANDSLMYLGNGNRLLVYNPIKRTGYWASNERLNDDLKSKVAYMNMFWNPQYGFHATTGADYIAQLTEKGQINLINLVKNELLEKGGYFHSADMDADGNLWVINKGYGIYCYSPKTKTRAFWNDMDGLMDNHLHAMKADHHGNVWMAYFNRFSILNVKRNSFASFSIPYSERNTYYYNCLTLRSDSVVMGNVNNDVFEFYPNNLNIIPKNTMPQFSVISISGKDYFPEHLTNLTLEPDQNSIHFKFGLLINPNIFTHEFEYQLEGSDETWIHSSEIAEAKYNNLRAGNYIFRVRAKGRNTNWQSAERILYIKINTPFYKSNGFLALLLFTVSLIIFYLYRYRLKQRDALYEMESRAQASEKEKAVVMYDSLKQQLNPHFLFNSLTSLSGLIYTNQDLAAEFLEKMSGIYRYILQHGDQETVTLKEEIRFAELFIHLQKTRFKNGLIINLQHSSGIDHYRIAPVTLQNLIENAIKHNMIDADSPLVIDIYLENDYLVVSNNLQRKSYVETSNKQGLKKLMTLYAYLTDKPILIEESTTQFSIKIPLI